MNQRRVLVIGGGITGLSAAYYTKKKCAEDGVQIELTLSEKSANLGGKIQTLRKDGFVIEKGPDSFLARKLPIIKLSNNLGLENELIATNPQAKRTYIVNKGKLHLMPGGLVLGIPTEIKPFMKTGLISPAGKLRASLDLLLPAKEGNEDESLGGFLERRLGREVVSHIAEPLLSGIYAGDAHKLSLLATFPQFREVERKFGSLIRGTAAGRKKPPQREESTADREARESKEAKAAEREVGAKGIPTVAKSSVFLSYKGGLRSLVDALARELNDDRHTRVLLGCGVTSIVSASAPDATDSDSSSADSHRDEGYLVTFDDGQTQTFHTIIMALPNYAMASLLPDLPSVKELGNTNYVSVANVIMAFRKDDLERELDASGFLVPRHEGRFITACTWTSSKWPHTSPEEYVLLRCYIGRSGAEEWMQLPDDELMRRTRQDLRDLTGFDAEPMFYEVTRLPRSMPQYPVGHVDNIKRARADLAQSMPGVYITGAGFHGVGLPDCIRQGEEAAKFATDYLK